MNSKQEDKKAVTDREFYLIQVFRSLNEDGKCLAEKILADCCVSPSLNIKKSAEKASGHFVPIDIFPEIIRALSRDGRDMTSKAFQKKAMDFADDLAAECFLRDLFRGPDSHGEWERTAAAKYAQAVVPEILSFLDYKELDIDGFLEWLDY